MTQNAQTLLKTMLSDMESAPPEYRPTNFWSHGLRNLVAELQGSGFENFRNQPEALSYFVPNYGGKFYLKHKSRIDGMLGRLSPRKQRSFKKAVTGLEKARTDYRLFQATTTHSTLGLNNISESSVGGGERFEFNERNYGRTMLNYLRALTLLERAGHPEKIKSWLEIGGGYGTLGEIVLKGQSDAFYVNVDIPPVAAVSTWYLQQVFGQEAVLDYGQSREMTEFDLQALSKKYRAVVLCPWQLPHVTGEVDAFANSISFQEMEPSVVANYVKLVQPLTKTHVLMRNSRHGKNLASAPGSDGVIEQVTTQSAIEAFDAFTLTAQDSLLHGDETPDRMFRSEVNLLTRKA